MAFLTGFAMVEGSTIHDLLVGESLTDELSALLKSAVPDRIGVVHTEDGCSKVLSTNVRVSSTLSAIVVISCGI